MANPRDTTSRRGFLLGLGAAGLLAATATGCVARARGAVVVDSAPPPPRYVTVQPRPGHVWIRGRWVFVNNRWAWRDGYWVEARRGRARVHGRWVRRKGRWHWLDGHWKADKHKRGRKRRGKSRVRTRDHRRKDERVESKRGRKR